MTYAGLSLGTPAHAYLLQQASGNATDVGSGTAVNLTLTGSPTFQSTLSGWSTKGVAYTDNLGSQFASTSASLPDISVTKSMLLIYAAITGTPAAIRSIGCVGTAATSLQAKCNGTPRVICASGANSSTGLVATVTTLVPYILNTQTGTLYTLDEKITPTAGTLSGKQIRIGAISSNAPPMTMLGAWEWEGSAVGSSVDADMKTLQQKLGFTVNWS
jgi:hypothetical protein